MYAEDYFGPNNRECLCKTCETLGRNGWSSGDEPVKQEETPEASSVEPEDGSQPMMRTRSKRKNTPLEPLEELPPDRRARRKPTQLEILTPPDSDRATSEDMAAVKPGVTRQDSGFSQPPITPSSEPQTQYAVRRPPTPPLKVLTAEEAVYDIAESLLALSQSPRTYQPTRMHSRVHSLDLPRQALSFGPLPGLQAPATPTLDSFGHPKLQAPPLLQSVSVTAFAPNRQPTMFSSDLGTTTTAYQQSPAPTGLVAVKPEPTSYSQNISSQLPKFEKAAADPPIKADKTDSDDDLSEISDSELDRLDSVIVKPKVKKKSPTPPRKGGRGRSGSKSMPPQIVRKRVPGDYLEPQTIQEERLNCHDCREDFIHGERWYIPRSCKRCERHSKIYGLIWPKTTKKKGDTEV